MYGANGSVRRSRCDWPYGNQNLRRHARRLVGREAFLERTAKWASRSYGAVSLQVYGDASGEGRKSSASRTDWQIVKECLARYRERFHTAYQVPSANPPVKDRVNCVNALLQSHAGDRRLFVDPNASN